MGVTVYQAGHHDATRAGYDLAGIEPTLDLSPGAHPQDAVALYDDGAVLYQGPIVVQGQYIVSTDNEIHRYPGAGITERGTPWIEKQAPAE
jgi:hypothetical protein